jgi:hypothetical protein
LKFSLDGENYGGTYARIDIPKRVILLTELHGELDFRLTERSDGTDIALNCTMTLNQAEKAAWEKLTQDTFEKFKLALSNAS